MKRTKSLFNQIADYENIRLAWLKARKGKTGKKSVINFRKNVNENLRKIRENLMATPPVLSDYVQFKITDPKERVISVVPFCDRVLHHAVMNVLEPVFERQFIFHTYACRKGKGTHAAALQAYKMAKRAPYFLKLDVKKYFDTIDHTVLKTRLCRIIKDSRCLSLLFGIIDSYTTQHPDAAAAPTDKTETQTELQIEPQTETQRESQTETQTEKQTETQRESQIESQIESQREKQREKGLPIGNLTSQFFANFYLSPLDHFVLETLKPTGYIRYMDDIVIFADTPARLKEIFCAVRAFCQSELFLTLKEPVSGKSTAGVPFLGWRLSAKGIRILPRTKKRMHRKLRQIRRALAAGTITTRTATARTTAVLAARKILII